MIEKKLIEEVRAEKGHLISESFRDEKNQLVRNVAGKKIIQIEEKTQADRELNEAINLWRMR